MSELPQTQGKAKSGFDDIDKKKPQDQEIISKEETMFKVDGEGKAIPEKYPIYIYDRTLDNEIGEEELFLIQTIKQRKAVDKLIRESNTSDQKEMQELKAKIEKTVDKKLTGRLVIELTNKEKLIATGEIQTKIKLAVATEEINGSKEILINLKKEKEKQKQTKYVEVIPCTVSEAYQSIEKGKSVEGKEVDDWVADLITKKIVNPKYTLEESELLKSDYKLALKEAIMKVSNYQVQSYRELMMQKSFEEKTPLSAGKKEEPNGDSTPAVSAS